MRPSLALVALSALAASASADVITVAPTGADHTQIQPAVDQAVPGDIVILRPAPAAYYQGFTIAGKGIAVVSENVGQGVNGTITVRDVPPGPGVVLRNFSASPMEAQGLRVSNCTGPVRLERMSLGTFVVGAVPAYDSLATVTDCADVAVDRTTIMMSDVAGQQYTFTGLRLVRSRFVATGSTIRGTRGTWGSGLGGVLLDGGTGSPGVDIDDSRAWFRGVDIHGGPGGGGLAVCQPPALVPTDGGDGGFGISILSGAVSIRGGTLQGGIPGTGGFAGNCTPGTQGAWGAALNDPNGLVTQVGGPVRTLFTDRPIVREGQSLDVHVTTVAGDVVYLVLARRTGIGNTPSIEGQPLVVDPMQRRLLGTARGSSLSSSIAFGELGAGIEGKVVHMQAVVVGAGGQGTWTNLSSVAWVDSSL